MNLIEAIESLEAEVSEGRKQSFLTQKVIPDAKAISKKFGENVIAVALKPHRIVVIIKGKVKIARIRRHLEALEGYRITDDETYKFVTIAGIEDKAPATEKVRYKKQKKSMDLGLSTRVHVLDAVMTREGLKRFAISQGIPPSQAPSF